MKSVMEEASTIMKAIEKGWISAGQPKEFTIKIFEEPQRNFLGLTIRSAKIGVFFSDEHVAKAPEPQPRQKAKPVREGATSLPSSSYGLPTEARRVKESGRGRTTSSIPSGTAASEQAAQRETQKLKAKEQKTRTPRQAKETTKPTQESTQSKQEALQEAPQIQQPVWAESMVEDIQQWLRDTLSLLGAPTVHFAMEPQHFYLRIQFASPIFEDKAREKYLFSSLSTLFLQMLKLRYKRPLKGYKIVFIGAA